MNFKEKLRKLYKLQVSINSLTEDIYKKQIQTISSKKPPKKTLTPRHKISHVPSSSPDNSEISKIISELREQNTSLTQALNKNITTLSFLFDRLLEKTLNLLVILQQHLPPSISSDFSSEKLEIELNFKHISTFICRFSELVQDFSLEDTEKFGTTSNQSFDKLETEDFDIRHLKPDPFAKSRGKSLDESWQADQYIKIIETDIETEKSYIRSLAQLHHSIETEKKELKKIKFNEKLNLVSDSINKLIDVVQKGLVKKESKISDLKSVKTEFNRSLRTQSRRESCFDGGDRGIKHLSTLTGKTFSQTLNNSLESEKFSIFKPIVFKLDDLDESSNSNNSLSGKPPRNREESYRDLRRLKTQIELLKQNEEKNIQKIRELETVNVDLKSKEKQFTNNSLKELKINFAMLKEFCENELSIFSNDLSRNFSVVFKKILNKSDLANKKFVNEIEDMKENNDALMIQIETMKEVFQDEVKQIHSESESLKKNNKDLKEKNEFYVRVFNELGKELGVEIDEKFDGLKRCIFFQCSFIRGIQREFKENNLEYLERTLKNLANS